MKKAVTRFPPFLGWRGWCRDLIVAVVWLTCVCEDAVDGLNGEENASGGTLALSKNLTDASGR